MLLMFAIFTLTPLTFIIAFNYHQNEASAIANLKQRVSSSMAESALATTKLFHIAENNMALVADFAAADLGHFRIRESAEVLWRVLVHVDHIDAIYVSLEDGYHRVVTRMDDERRRSDPRIPKDAKWHVGYIDDFSAGSSRARHRSFFSDWGQVTGLGYSTPTDLDLRSLAHYQLAESTREMVVGEPSINPDTGSVVISLGYPIMVGDRFVGFVGANMTLKGVSDYLSNSKLSPGSESVIYDSLGKIIAVSNTALASSSEDNAVAAVSIDDLVDGAVRKAMLSLQAGEDKQKILTIPSGARVLAAVSSFPSDFDKDWAIFSVSPIKDFIGDILQSNRSQLEVAFIVVIIEILLIIIIYFSFSRTIRDIVMQLSAISRFDLSLPQASNFFVKEIELIGTSVEQMKSSLRSFGRYVPSDLVRELLASGRAAELGGERRRMTIHFSDIVGFTSIAENMPPEELVEELGSYFSTMRGVLQQHEGIVDKFMGDGILAFFNAPLKVDLHEIRACHAALEAQEKLAADRKKRANEGRPEFYARVGLSVGEVIVGNIGTPERFAYTVIGDAVNLASRLESLNKVYATSIIAPGELVTSTGDAFVWRRLDRVAVVGRVASTEVFELIGLKGEVDSAQLLRRDTYENALNAYFESDFVSAATMFRDLTLQSSDTAAEVMALRSEHLVNHPPEGEWTGVHISTEK
ncbi:MAG: adenylate cyclase [Porticoccaceae bacterium]|jgi:adenylate cyclase